MRATQLLHNLGQSIWLDNITRDLPTSGTLKHYRDEFSVTGLTSNPTIFDKAVKSGAYDDSICSKLTEGKSAEELFFELAIEDLAQVADLFRPIYDRTNGLDGWVSLEVSPLLAYNTDSTLAAAKELHSRAGRPNLFIKIPGTREGLPAIEEAIFEGVPINVTLLFSREQYLAAAEAFLRGIERRIEAGRTPDVGSVASVFISRWDSAVADKVPESLQNRLGIAIAGRTYKAACALLSSPRWRRIYGNGGWPQRLLWASTGAKDPRASEVLYVKALAAPFTVNTMPESTLNALSRNNELDTIMSKDGGDCEELLAQFASEGIDVDAGVITFLERTEGLAGSEVDELLNKQSGLLGLSGLSSDMREILKAADAGEARASASVKAYRYRIRKYIGAYMAVLGGLDLLVFTGGIGQGSEIVRALAVQGLTGMGIRIDEMRNRDARGFDEVCRISPDDSKVVVLVVPTDEERMMACEALRSLRACQ